MLDCHLCSLLAGDLDPVQDRVSDEDLGEVEYLGVVGAESFEGVHQVHLEGTVETHRFHQLPKAL